jgi:fructokinase
MPAMTTRRPAVHVACFGEALWDILPDGIFLGGAPLNVAYHLSRQGIASRLISAVGRDFLGDEIHRRLAGWGIEGRFVARSADFPTGSVRAVLDANGAATYAIRRGVAWDHIPVSRAVRRTAAPAALVFGTLALREPANRRALDALCTAWPEAWRVLDLNLRDPFTTHPAVAFALERAQLLKLNADELARVSGRTLRGEGAIERAARAFAGRHELDRVCVTAGDQGAGLLWDARWHWEEARPVIVRDTVGSGDAFLAGLLAAKLLRQAEPRAALAQACRLGEFVAARPGATPAYAVDLHGRPREMRRH